MTFTVHGGRDAGIAVFNSVKLFKRLLNMGDAKSLITHPASTTHRQLRRPSSRRPASRPTWSGCRSGSSIPTI